MEIELHESSIGRIYRVGARATMICTVLVALLIVILSFKTSIFFPCLMLFVLVFYLYQMNRVVKIIQVKQNSVVLQDKGKTISINKENIKYVFKMFSYTVSSSFGIILALKSGSFLARKRYIFVNDPQNDLIDIFKKMGVKLLNVS